MQKLLHSKALIRFTAFLLAFCCIFSMAPTMAFAVDEDTGGDSGETSEDLDFREIWVISKPGTPVRIIRDNEGNTKVEIADMETGDDNDDERNWNGTKLVEITNELGQKEWVYAPDPDLQDPNTPGRPEPVNGIGWIRQYTDFEDAILPGSTIPNWDGAEFKFVGESPQPFDRTWITEDNEDIRYWAGSFDGGSTFYLGGNKDSWGGFIDTYHKVAPSDDTDEPIPNANRDRWPSPLGVQFPTEGLKEEGSTYYFTQMVIPKSFVDWYVEEIGYMGEDNTPNDGYDLTNYSMVNLPNNTMFAYRSTTELPAPETDDVGTVIFDWNLPGNEATVEYLKPGGEKVDIPTDVKTNTIPGVEAIFRGWYTEPEGGDKITGTQVEVQAGTAKVYYAQWEFIVDGGSGQIGEGDMYVVYFDYNLDGAGVTSAYCAAGEFTWTVTVDGESKTYTAQLPFQFPEDPYRPGYTFLGWATSANAKSPNVDKATWLPEEGKGDTLYGVWEENTYYLTWDANGGQTTTQTEQKYNELVQTPATEPTREGYTFGGWYLDKDCSAPLTADTKVYGDRTFYAKWTSEKVYVNYYDTRQGTSLIGQQTYNYGDLLDLMAPMEDTDGWTFTNWAIGEGGPQAADGTPLVSPTVTYHKGGNGSDVASDAGYWTLDIYAVWAQKTFDFEAKVVWDDLQDNDGARPQSVKLGLVSSINDELVDTKTVTDDGNDTQTVVFEDLPITTSDVSTEKITYKLIFLGYTDCDGVYRDIHDTAASSGEIDVATASSVDDSVSTKYTYAINNYVTGYAGYIKLDHNLITTGNDIAFTIQWEDQSDNDGKRPGSVTLVLYANGVPVYQNQMHNSGTGVERVSAANCQVTEDGDNWTYIFKDYQKYHEGKAIEYTVAIKNSDDMNTTFNENGYTTEYLNASPNAEIGSKTGAIVSRDIELIDKEVTINWDDESNRDNQRPENVTVTLTAYQWNNKTFRWESNLVKTATITGGAQNDTWKYTFEDVKKYNGGQEIIYEVAITSDLNAHLPEGAYAYTWVANEMVIDISKNRNVKDVPVTIEWDDHNNNDTIRPTTVIVQLYADHQKLEGAQYAKLLTGDPTAAQWEYTFENLPVYREGEEGQEILYTIQVEEAVEDSLYGTYISMANGEEQEIVRYTASYTDVNNDTTDDPNKSNQAYVRLTHETDQGTFNIYANWHDESNVDGKRPTEVLVDLYKQVDGVREFKDTFTMTGGNDDSWTYSIKNLPLYEDGHKITYYAEVSDEFRNNLKDNYNYSISLEGNVVHLYYTPSVGYVTGHINWQDNNDNDNIRPDSVKGTLYANGVSTGKTLDFNEDNDWTQTWQDVASYYNNNGVTGTAIVYSIVIETPDGYSVEYVPETTTTVDPDDIQINLSHETDQQGLEATIYWNDNNDSDKQRPDSVKVQLYANGEVVVGKTLEITGEGNVWTGNFTDLDIYKDGELIDYTIRLADDAEKNGYSAMTAGMNLYMSRNADKANMNVSFTFNDNNNADGVRPTALYLNLTANGVPVDGPEYKQTVNFSVDEGKIQFTDLPVFSGDGNRIKYNVAVEFDSDYGATDYTVKTSKDVELSTSGTTNQVVVTLSRASDTGAETGHIYWFDNNNQRGNRPTEISIVVSSDASIATVGTYTIDSIKKTVTDSYGNIVGGVTISEWGNDNTASCWTYTIENLPQNAIIGGVSHEIYYSAKADATGVTTWYNVADGTSLDISLTHKNYEQDVGASQQDFNITVSWMDNANAWEFRPNDKGVDVTLYANGNEYKTVHMNQSNCNAEVNANAWTYTFEDLPTYLNGNAVVWTAGIDDVMMYTPTVDNQQAYANITMTQSMGFDFTINWEDSDDDDAVRPDEVTIDIYADGSKVGSVTLTGVEGNTWTGSVKDLAVWRTAPTDTGAEPD